MLNINNILSHKKLDHSSFGFGIGCVIGILFFVLIYGASTLNVTYDSWIYAGYIESDIIQRYAGWQFFRYAEWTMPITVANNIAMPVGMAITFADCVPIVAVLCKLVQGILPINFQYFGWYNLLNCALQGGFAFLLISHFKQSKIYCAIGTLLFVSYPIFTERLFRHDALASQWLLLAAFLCYFKAKKGKWCGVGLVLLCVLAAATHVYFLPMICAIFLASIFVYVKNKKTFLQASIYVAISGVSAVIMLYLLGIITRGGNGAALGFGEYSMNLNSLFNPSSFNAYAQGQHMTWSQILPVLPQNFKQYEGFNYLGFGVIIAIIAAFAWVILTIIRGIINKNITALKSILLRLKQHCALATVCVIMSVFALSTVVVWGTTTLFTVPIPSFLAYIGSVFRASGRFFWPMSYLLLLGVILFIAKIVKPKFRAVALAIVLVIQLVDLSGAFYEKHKYFANGPIVADTVYETDEWKFFAQNYNIALCVDPIVDYEFAAGLIRYNPNMQTNALIANRGTHSVMAAIRYDALVKLQESTALPKDTMYIGKDSITDEIIQKLHPQAKAYKIGEYIIVATTKEGCPAKEYSPR